MASSLHSAFRSRGFEGMMAVGSRHTRDDHVFEIPNEQARKTWARSWNRAAAFTNRALPRVKGSGRIAQMMRTIGSPASAFDRWYGRENFDYPGTWKVLTLQREMPDIVQLHNLHGDYFDLRALPWLSHRVPTAITLHDAWMLSGHCAHSFDCGRWETGCGSCPDLSIPPAVTRDDTAANWQRKQAIYAKSKLYVITPSAWLMRKVHHSMLAAAAVETRVIPNGVDLAVFNPGSRQEARARLDLPQDAEILLFAANGIRNNPWKDYRSLQQAVRILAASARAKLLFIALGEAAPDEQIGDATIRFKPFTDSRDQVADYYRASDVYVHAARVDTFPNTIIEALACGTPVVATGVGGIPEQIRSLAGWTAGDTAPNGEGASTATGIVVEPGDGEALGRAAEHLLKDSRLRMTIGENAARDAHQRFSLAVQVDAYLSLYKTMLANARDRSDLGELPRAESLV